MKTNEILVSVIIPTYRRTDFLDEALSSVFNQTYKNIEIIVCDDNADFIESRMRVKDIVSKYPDIILIQNKENLGGALNRNEGIKVAKGELISFLDDDDVYVDTRIEKVVEAYKEHKYEKIGIIYTFCYTCDINLKITGSFCYPPTPRPLVQHMCNCICATSQWTVPAHVFREVGMFEDAKCKQDSIMLLRILGADYKPLCVEQPLSYFRNHNEGRISENYKKHLEGEINLHKYIKSYYYKLSNQEITQVEAAYQRVLLQTYSGMHERLKTWLCFHRLLKIGGLRFVDVRTILFLFASPTFYKEVKRICLSYKYKTKR